jgi:ferredoxin
MSSGNWIKFEGQKYIVGPGERALDAMLRQGAPVTFSCRKGTCRSCMMQAVSGEPGAAAQEPLPQEWRDLGLFLPCCATDVNRVEAKRPDLSLCVQEAVVAETIQAAPDILRLRLEPLNELDWTPGQVIGLMNPSGAARSYSIVSCKDDYYIEINLRLHRHGVVSGWAKGLSVGDSVRFQGPTGNVVWREDLAERRWCSLGPALAAAFSRGSREIRSCAAIMARSDCFMARGARLIFTFPHFSPICLRAA